MSAAVEVYEVGKQQLWDWCGWTGRANDYHFDTSKTIYCYADSLRKGMYLVMETSAKFGRFSPRLNVVCACSSMRGALVTVANYVDYDERHRFDVDDLHDGVILHDYEIWHVVDDFDLWGNWEFCIRNAKIDAQRKASACRISLDNGHTFLDPVRDEADLQELIEYLDEYPHHWDVIVTIMDDETREFTHLTSSYTGMLPDEPPRKERRRKTEAEKERGDRKTEKGKEP